MTDRFDKFTERARKTLQYAQEESRRFNHNYIGTEHILLGLVRESDGVAAHVLNKLGIDVGKVRSSVEFIIGRGDRMVMGEIGLTPRSKRVIELAVDEARRLNHHYIGTEHLLLGLVREGEGIAAGVLESLGVSLEKVRAATMEVLKSSGGQPTSATGATWSSYLSPDETGGQLETRDLEIGDRVHYRAGFFSGSLEDIAGPAHDLREWADANLDFSLLSHVDDSLLNVLRHALPISLLLVRSYVGTDHFLAAMVRDNRSTASLLLAKHRANVDNVYRLLQQGIGSIWSNPFTYEAMRAIRLAIEEARSAGVKATEAHLLLGIMLEGTSTAYQALAREGITADEVRAYIRAQGISEQSDNNPEETDG